MFSQDNSSFYNLMSQISEMNKEKEVKIARELGWHKKEEWQVHEFFDIKKFEEYLRKEINKYK